MHDYLIIIHTCDNELKCLSNCIQEVPSFKDMAPTLKGKSRASQHTMPRTWKVIKQCKWCSLGFIRQ